MFVLDFLCIHPFEDGNGRMSRLLTLLLLYKSGYMVGKYIGIEKLIENTKDIYYETLESSSYGWHKNDYLPFLRYYLGILIDKCIGKFTKKDIIEGCHDISKITVNRTLAELLKNNYIKKIGVGRSTAYLKI